jgi:murein L,D-transpeptidase YafK
MFLLLGAAASLLFAGARDTLPLGSKRASPTVRHTPVVGIKSTIIADSLVVEKSKRTLTVYSAGSPVRTYQVALGTQPKGDKIKMGDGRTPEGVFTIDFKNAQSKYYKAFHISYPDAAHAARAEALGVSPGGDIMIHGLPPRYASLGAAHREFDWTEGCIALTDQEIDELWSEVPQGAVIHIKP